LTAGVNEFVDTKSQPSIAFNQKTHIYLLKIFHDHYFPGSLFTIVFFVICLLFLIVVVQISPLYHRSMFKIKIMSSSPSQYILGYEFENSIT